MKDLFAAAVAAPLQFMSPGQAEIVEPLHATEIKGDQKSYQIYAPPGSYDENLKEGQTKLLILELNHNPKIRHAGLVAHIAQLSSETMAHHLGLDIRPEIVEMSGSTRDHDLFDELQEADVINYSAGTVANNLASISASGMGDPNDTFKALSRPIIVQAVGNHGRAGQKLDRGTFDRDTTDNLQFYPYSIQVGEARLKDDGTPVLDKHSARSGPTLVALNLTDQQTSYKYMDLEVYARLSPELQDNYHLDQQGFFSKIEGSSFAGPNPAGALGSAKEAFPNLSNSEHLAALSASARLPQSVQSKARLGAETLPYEAFGWGYGLFDSQLYSESLERLNELARTLPDLNDVQSANIEFEQEKTTYNNKPYYLHRFDIKEDFTATKLTFEFQNPLRTLPADHFIVISPTGLAHPVPASLGTGTSRFVTEAFLGQSTKGEWQILSPGESRAVTPKDKSYDAITWRFDPQTKIESHIAANFTLHGQEKGPDGHSLISLFIEQVKLERDLRPGTMPGEIDQISSSPEP